MVVCVCVCMWALEELFLLWIRQLWIAWQSRCYLLPIDKVSILNCWWWRCVLIKYLWLKKTHILHLISMRQWSSFTTTILPFVHYLFLVFVFFFVRCRWILKKKQSKLRLLCVFSLLLMETFEANTPCHQIIFYYLHAVFCRIYLHGNLLGTQAP